MPPTTDPYAGPIHKSIDALLLLITIVVIAFVFLNAKQKRHTPDGSDSVRAPQPQHQLVAR